LIVSKENGELNAENTKYNVCLHLMNRMHDKITTLRPESFERAAKFEYFGSTLTNQTSSHEGTDEQIGIGECLLLFGPESFICQ
jgi:hypothetical protein